MLVAVLLGSLFHSIRIERGGSLARTLELQTVRPGRSPASLLSQGRPLQSGGLVGTAKGEPPGQGHPEDLGWEGCSVKPPARPLL